MEASQYEIKVPVTPGPGMYAESEVVLRLTKHGTSWVASITGFITEWKFVNLEVAENVINAELIPLICEAYDAAAKSAFAWRDLDNWNAKSGTITGYTPEEVDEFPGVPEGQQVVVP